MNSIIKDKIRDLVAEYYRKFHPDQNEVFRPGDRIPYAGRFYDEDEINSLVEASLDFWLTEGRFSKDFEDRLSAFVKCNFVNLVNSGSSANLLSFMTLTNPKLKEHRILPGDEVITVAACFPTSIAPIIQYGAVPVFLDVTIPQYNVDVTLLEEALSERTKAVMLAHTLGNPFDLFRVTEFCKKHNLWLIEDNCDALGSKYEINGEWKYTGTIGDLGTLSFYPAHHITTGEGGAVISNDKELMNIVRSIRDWGRDCWCLPGCDNTCKNRFKTKQGELPKGYDHKYVYSSFGYNLKMTDMQAAIGAAQMNKLGSIIKKRKNNWSFLRRQLEDTENVFILPKPEDRSDPSWFGFILTLRENGKHGRNYFTECLENNNIQTRPLFSGNIIKHPCFDYIRGEKRFYRVVGGLENTDKIMKDTFWVGVYPGLDEDRLNYIVDIIKKSI